MPKPTGEQFRTLYHLSNSPEPPHTTPHPHYSLIPEEETPERRKGSNDVVFLTGEKRLDVDESRRYLHTYKVPESAISPETYSDDDWNPYHSIPQPNWKPNMELWQSLPASRLDALRRKQVIKFVNSGERVPVRADYGHYTAEENRSRYAEERLSMSYILPKPHINELGVEYQGVEEYDLKEQELEPRSVVQKRIRKSYGK